MQKAREDLNSDFRIRLQEEFYRRMRVNERYSIRAFAMSLGIDSSTLSQILAGKRAVSENKMSVICQKIGIQVTGLSEVQTNDYASLQLAQFTIISDWYHFAILELTNLKNFNPDPKWIARKLNIEPYEVSTAIERLMRLGFLTDRNGKLVKTQPHYTNGPEGSTSAAMKEYQRQVIQKALLAVDSCPQERKDISSMVIAADSRKLKIAKEKIKRFRRQLCAFLEDGEQDSVFHLALQLYPVTEIES